jgi:TP901 family phage tail tape measure protein
LAGTLGTITGQVRIDTSQAVAAYAALRAANIGTLLALRSASSVFLAAGAAIGGVGLLITAGFVHAIKAAADFERQLDFFGAVSNSTAAEMDAVRAKALQLGNATIFSASQVADAFVELGKAGISAKQIIDGVGEAVTSLGAAADIPLAEAANIITSAVQTFNLAATDAVHVADLLAGAANASIVEVTDLGVSLKYVGGVAAAISVPLEDTITAISLLGKAGIRGSTAGTSLRQILVSLTGTSKKAQGVMKKLGIITEDGANKFFDAQGKAKPLGEIFQILQDHTKGLTEAQRLSAFKIIFNNRALAAAAILSRQGAAGFKAMNAEIAKTTAAEVARKRLDNLSGDIEKLQSAIETLTIRAGGPFQNFLRGSVQLLTNLINAFNGLPPKVQSTLFVTLAITGALFLLIGAISTTIGLLFKFGANMLLLRGAIATVIKILASLRIALIATWLSALGPVGLIIAALILLGIAFVILWKKSETFRDIVKGVGAAIVTAFWAVVHFFQGLPAFFSKLWSQVVAAFNSAKAAVIGGWDAVVSFFQRVGSGIVNGIVTAFNAVVGFFSALPGRVLTFIVALVTSVLTSFRRLPEGMAFVLGFMLGLAVNIFLRLQAALAAIANAIVNAVVNYFTALPGRLAALWSLIWSTAVAVWNAIRSAVVNAARATYTGVISFFQQLPGRVAAFFQAVYNGAVSRIRAMASAVSAGAQAAYNGIINAIQALPGAIARFFQAAAAAAVRLMTSLKDRVVAIARALPGAVGSALGGLGSAISGAFQRAIGALGGLAGQAFEKAKSIGSSLWNGFKSGMGIGSPSYIERAMFQVHDTMLDEIGFLGRMVSKAHTISGQLPSIERTIAASQAAQEIQVNTTADRGSVGTQLKVSPPPPESETPTPSGLRMIQGELTIDARGKAYIRGIAEEVYDENAAFEDSLGRM